MYENVINNNVTHLKLHSRKIYTHTHKIYCLITLKYIV